MDPPVWLAAFVTPERINTDSKLPPFGTILILQDMVFSHAGLQPLTGSTNIAILETICE